MLTAAIDLSNLSFTYRYADRPALKGITLSIPASQFVVIVGPSGAGKSTLCYTLNGLIPGFQKGELTGAVAVSGQPVAGRKVSALARELGLVFQDFEGQLFSTNVELEVAFAPENLGVDRAEMVRRVRECLAVVGLTGLEDRDPATLSGGQKQRLAIASVLSLEPHIIVMDEPTTDLDPLGKEGIFTVSRRLRGQGLTMVVVEHETEEAAVADRVIIMNQGEVVADGTPAEILTRSEVLEEIGVQPLGAAQLSAHFGLEPTLDVAAAAEQLAARHYRVDPAVLSELQARDWQPGSAPEPGTPPPIVEIRNVEHRYANGVIALQGASLRIEQGEFVAIAGQNGSGKTTLVKHLNGLLYPSAGEVLINGAPTAGQSVLQLGRTVGYVFQNPDHQIFAETVNEEVAFGPRNQGVPPEQVAERVAEALAAVGLSGREQDDPFSMTKGERQRVAVASVLATRPQVIILDEPTTGLDYREQRLMMGLVQRLNAAGHTIICVTHTMWVVAEYARRTVVIKDGRIWMDGPTRQVMAREAELTEASLKPPQIVRISNRLGGTLLSLAECKTAIRGV